MTRELIQELRDGLELACRRVCDSSVADRIGRRDFRGEAFIAHPALHDLERPFHVGNILHTARPADGDGRKSVHRRRF